jgi:hypothetical protein
MLTKGPDAHAHTPPIIVRLRKAHYSLKQEPQLCHDEINTFLLFLGFTQSLSDPNHYILTDGMLILLYLDDMSKISQTTAQHGNSPPQWRSWHQFWPEGLHHHNPQAMPHAECS